MKGVFNLMKKYFTIFSIILLLSFNINIITVHAETKTFTQGIYNVRDSGLLAGTSYTVQNTSPTNKSLLIIFDNNQLMQELIRLEPNSPKYTLKPFQYDYFIVVIGDAKLVLS